MKYNGLLAVSVTTLLGLIASTSVTAAPSGLTPAQIKAANRAIKSEVILPDTITAKTNDYSGEDELPIPEGVRPIQGMNLPIKMREVKIYGLDHKGYDANFLRKAIVNAVKFHNTLNDAPKIKANFKVKRNANSYSILVNSEVYLALVYAIAQEITKKYQSDQFLLARAIVPEQKISQEGGAIEICVAEGYLPSNPTIVLPAGTKNAAQLRQRLAPHLNHLKNMKPLDFKKLERSLLLIRDMPGMEIKTTFKQALNNIAVKKSKPSSSICETALNNGAGSTALEVRVTLDKINGEVSIDNYGSDSLGPEVAKFKVGINSVFKAGDSFQLDAANTLDSGESLNFSINAQTLIGTNGLKAKFLYSKGKAEPGGFDDSLHIINKTQVIGASLEYPYIRSRKKNLSFEVGLRSHAVVTDSVFNTLEDASLNTLRLRATYDFSDKYNAVNLLSVGLVAGLSAKVDQSGIAAQNKLNENFVIVKGELARYQAISLPQTATGSLTWVNALSWQYTNEALFSSEEFALGGRNFGRGYDPAVITGDQAIAVKTELQYTNKNKYGKYKAYSFIDAGKLKNLDKVIAPRDVRPALASAGVGVEFQSNNNWFVNVELAEPIKITPKPTIEAKTKAYLQIGYRW